MTNFALRGNGNINEVKNVALSDSTQLHICETAVEFNNDGKLHEIYTVYATHFEGIDCETGNEMYAVVGSEYAATLNEALEYFNIRAKSDNPFVIASSFSTQANFFKNLEMRVNADVA